MYPSQFEYYAPTSLTEALALLQQAPGEGKLLAGGHSLLPLLKLRLTEAKFLVDLSRIPGLAYIRREGSAVAIGALTTHAQILRSAELRQDLPILPECAHVIGDLQVRNRGTIGGSLAHADPAADYPAVVLALEAELRVVGPRGERWVTARDFFVDLLTTALEPDEVLVEVRLALPPARTGQCYLKFPQPASRYALCGVAALVTLGADGTIARARVGVTGVGPTAYRAEAVERSLEGRRPTDETVAQAAAQAAEGVAPLADLHASADYRAHLARVFTRRALIAAIERAQAAH